MVFFGNCRLWSPANDGRALLVPQGEAYYVGYLAFRPGQRLKLIDAPVPGDFAAGVRRAETRLARLLASDALSEVHREGYMHLIHSQGQDIFAETMALAA